MCSLDLQDDFERNELVSLAPRGCEVYHAFTANAVIDRSARATPAIREISDTEKRPYFARDFYLLFGHAVFAFDVQEVCQKRQK